MTGFIKQTFIFLVQKTWKCEKHVKMGVLLHARYMKPGLIIPCSLSY